MLLLVLLFSSVGDIEDLDILKVLSKTRKREEGRGGRKCPDEEDNNE